MSGDGKNSRAKETAATPAVPNSRLYEGELFTEEGALLESWPKRLNLLVQCAKGATTYFIGGADAKDTFPSVLFGDFVAQLRCSNTVRFGGTLIRDFRFAKLARLMLGNVVTGCAILSTEGERLRHDPEVFVITVVVDKLGALTCPDKMVWKKY